MSQRELVVAIGEVIGRPLRFEEISRKRRGALPFPAPTLDMLLNAWSAAIGHLALVTSTVAEVTGRPARSFRDWVLDHVEAFR